MNELVRSAHRELDEEVHRLALAYQRTTQQAQYDYQIGILAAQQKFEAQLQAAMQAMSTAFEQALTK